MVDRSGGIPVARKNRILSGATNRLTEITQGSSTTTYTYDAAGRRTSVTLPNGVLVEYAYDNASRVTSITYKQNGTTVLGNLTYEYDKAGNRTKIGGSFARTGVPDGVSTTNYNAANQQTTFGEIRRSPTMTMAISKRSPTPAGRRRIAGMQETS